MRCLLGVIMYRYFLALIIMFLGLFICTIGILTAKNGKFRKCFFVWDNEEDGFYGNKRNWLKENRPNLDGKWWSSYNWCALRNPAFNTRYWKHTSLSCLPEDVSDIRFEGNTYNKDYRYSFAAQEAGHAVRERIWFKFSAVVDGKRRYCEYEMKPISATESRETFRGWKFYPNHHLDAWWIEKIKKDGWPKYKDRIIYTVMNKKVKE